MNRKDKRILKSKAPFSTRVNKIKIFNPYLTKINIPGTEMKIRKYQLKLANKVISDYKNAQGNPKLLKAIEEYMRLLVLHTGEGKTTLIRYLTFEMIKVRKEATGSYKGTIFIIAPRRELVENFQEDMEKFSEWLNKCEKIPCVVYSSLERGWAKDIKNFDTTVDAVKIVMLTDSMNLSRDTTSTADDVFLVIRDEVLGLNSKDSEAAKLDKVYNSRFKMHDKLNGIPAFKLVLTATPSTSHRIRSTHSVEPQYIYEDKCERKWIKPIGEQPFLFKSQGFRIKKGYICRVTGFNDYGMDTVDLLDINLDNFITKTLQIEENKQYAKKHNLKLMKDMDSFKPADMIKCDINDHSISLTVDKVYDYIVKQDIIFSKSEKKYKVKNLFTGKMVTVTYPKPIHPQCVEGPALLHPRKSDQWNKYDNADMVNPSLYDNILVVCAKGDMGINIPNLIEQCSLRTSDPVEERIAERLQFEGRMNRNCFVDDYELAQRIADVSEVQHYSHINAILEIALLMITKSISLVDVKVNRLAAEEWYEGNDNHVDKKARIEKILLDNGYSIPYTKKIIDGNGKTASFSYEDMRDGKSKCEVEGCRQVALIEFKRVYMEEQGKSELEANHLAVKGALQNCHILNKDGKIIIQCFIHHTVETQGKEHWRSKNDEKRIA